MSLLLEITTPETMVLSDSVDGVVVPTPEGELGLLPGHIPVMAAVAPGELRLNRGGSEETMAVDRGFLQVFGDKVSLITEAAINVVDIDLSSVTAARERAEQALKEAHDSQMDPAQIEELEQIARFAMLQELISQKNRTGV